MCEVSIPCSTTSLAATAAKNQGSLLASPSSSSVLKKVLIFRLFVLRRPGSYGCASATGVHRRSRQFEVIG